MFAKSSIRKLLDAYYFATIKMYNVEMFSWLEVLHPEKEKKKRRKYKKVMAFE